MEQNTTKDYYTIDVSHILKALWSKIWIVAIAGIVAAAFGFLTATFFITPKYSSSILLYVNNSSINLNNTSFSISASDISASQSLVKTYTELLKNRTTLERVILKADVDYTYKELYGMVEAGASNDTQVMRVTVTAANPYEASRIANTIAEVLPERISEIIDGASMEVVDSAIPHLQKDFPNITKYTAFAMLLGIVAAVALIIIIAIMDDTIYDENYVIETYNYPILAKVPNLLSEEQNTYKYYKKPKTNARN